MRVLSLSEFGRYCYEKAACRYVFSTSNQSQKWYPIGIAMRFSTVYVGLQPNRICLVNDSMNRICFERVKSVCVDEDVPGFSFKFDVVCTDESNSVVSYTVFAE